MSDRRLKGLFAAAYTPMRADGSLRSEQFDALAEHLFENGAQGLYVCGSTGEGPSLSTAERKSVAELFVRASGGRGSVVVQVGHNSLAEARELAAHAQKIGATAVSATCPSYFKPADVEGLVDTMADVAQAAPELPFYYYHIPALTGVSLDMPEFLLRGGERIANLRGLKFTSHALHEFQACLELEDGRFDLLWGTDEMLLGAAIIGAQGAVGSTYNFAAPLYVQMLKALGQGDLETARLWQARSVHLVRTIMQHPFHAAAKSVLGMLGCDCGPCRLPLKPLAASEAKQLERELQALGFFDWLREAKRS